VNPFLEAIRQRVLVLDGAMGTLLQERGLPPGGCPELMNRTAAEVVAGIHGEYAAAGAEILVTNTFGGNRPKLAHYGLEGEVADLNRRGVELARRGGGAGCFVAGSVGPTGRFLEPVGDAGFLEMVEVYAEQIRALAEAGADLSAYGEEVSRADGQVVLRIPKDEASAITARLLSEQNVADLTVEDTPIDDVIDQVFAQTGPVEQAA